MASKIFSNSNMNYKEINYFIFSLPLKNKCVYLFCTIFIEASPLATNHNHFWWTFRVPVQNRVELDLVKHHSDGTMQWYQLREL